MRNGRDQLGHAWESDALLDTRVDGRGKVYSRHSGEAFTLFETCLRLSRHSFGRRSDTHVPQTRSIRFRSAFGCLAPGDRHDGGDIGREGSWATAPVTTDVAVRWWRAHPRRSHRGRVRAGRVQSGARRRLSSAPRRRKRILPRDGAEGFEGDSEHVAAGARGCVPRRPVSTASGEEGQLAPRTRRSLARGPTRHGDGGGQCWDAVKSSPLAAEKYGQQRPTNALPSIP